MTAAVYGQEKVKDNQEYGVETLAQQRERVKQMNLKN